MTRAEGGEVPKPMASDRRMTARRVRQRVGRMGFGAVLFAVAAAWASPPVRAQEKGGPPPAGRPESRPDSSTEKSTSSESQDWYHGLYIEAAPEFETGRFGTKFRTEYTYLPLTLGYEGDRVLATVTVPWEIERTHGNVVFVGGRPVQISKNGTRSTKTESGLGDTLLDLGYYVVKQDKEKSLPSLLLDADVKFPSADDERGLGTGSYDGTLRATADFTFWNKLLVQVEAAYGIIGQPEDFSRPKFHDTISWGGGVGWALDADNELWIRTDGSTPIVYGSAPYSLLYAEYDHFFKNGSKVYLELGFGTTTATPGLSVTIGYKYYF